MINPKDGNGEPLQESDRIFIHDVFNSYAVLKGTLHYEPERNIWYADWDDGSDNIILNFGDVWKLQ